jgi:hypothetical protein
MMKLINECQPKWLQVVEADIIIIFTHKLYSLCIWHPIVIPILSEIIRTRPVKENYREISYSKKGIFDYTIRFCITWTHIVGKVNRTKGGKHVKSLWIEYN